MNIPTREQFREAARALWPEMTVEDVDKMYDLLTGPPEPFMAAMAEWADDFERREKP